MAYSRVSLSRDAMGRDDQRSGELARTALQLLALGTLIAASLWIVRPFLLAGVWAATIVVAVWPLLLRTQRCCGGRRAPAVAILTVALLLTLLVPLYFGIRAGVSSLDDLGIWLRSARSWTLPPPPTWLEQVPILGQNAASQWRELAAEGREEIARRLAPHVRALARWSVVELGGLGSLVLHFLIATILSAILFARGEAAAYGVCRFAHRLAGAQGERAVHLAGQAIRAVAIGVVLTALLQTALVALGFMVVAVPFAPVLIGLSFMLSIAQIGPAPLLVGVVIWSFSEHGPLWGSAYLVWALICAAFDNIVRPVLIQRGAHLPLLLIFGGVLGGLIAFGVIGLFIGPVVLAVAFTLLRDWIDEDREPAPSP